MSKKILAAAVCAVLCLGIVCGASLFGKSKADAAENAGGGAISAPEPQFDSGNIALTFSVMSDTHMGFGDEAEASLRNALSKVTLRRYTPNGLDALLFCGDQTQTGQREEAELFSSVLRSKFDLTQTAAIMCHGNHDTCWSGNISRAEFVEAYGQDVYSFDQPDTDPATGNRHAIVNGYHFLAVEIDYYTGKDNTNPLSAETEAWLKSTLDKITAEEPDKYVFLACHCPAPDTVYGSYSYNSDGPWGASKELAAVLEGYSQVVAFSGHTHYAINDDRSINQSSYTQVHVGSTTDMVVDSDYLEKITTRREESCGYVVEVDNKGSVRFTRIDFARNKQIKNYWYLDPCKADGSHLNRYTAEVRAATNAAPEFPQDKQLVLDELDGNKMRITYPTATDDDMVFYYRIVIYDKDGNVAETVCSYSPWYFDPDLSEIPAERMLLKNFDAKPVKVEVTAYDSFGGKSETLSATLGEYPSGTTGDNGDNLGGDKKSGCSGAASAASAMLATAALTVSALLVMRKKKTKNI